jgi:tetratricopeptide (TPR) repeat protein
MTLSVGKALLEARRHISNRNYYDARKVYTEILAKYPKNQRAISGYKKLNSLIDPNKPPTFEPPKQEFEELIDVFNNGSFQKALEIATDMLKAFPGSLNVYNIIGASYAKLRQHEKAIDHYHSALAIKRTADVLINLGISYKSLGKTGQALDSFNGALKLKPNDSEIYHNIGLVFEQQGNSDQAINNYQKAINQKPSYSNAYNSLGKAHMAKGDVQLAIKTYKKTLKIDPLHIQALNNLGLALSENHENNAAIDSFNKAIEVNPKYYPAYNNLGNIFRDTGNVEAAKKNYTKAVQLKPNFGRAHRNLATLTRYSGSEDHIAKMMALYISKGLLIEDKIHIGFALGKVFEDSRNFEKSFEFYQQANALAKSKSRYKLKADGDLFRRIKQISDSIIVEPKSAIQTPNTQQQKPVFIVGMPRSGTTLVEQVLASHSKIHGAGELNALGKTVQDLNLLNCTFTEKLLMSIRNHYFSSTPHMDTSTPFFTDKMPINFRWVGFIAQAFPEAKVIHVKRNPMATIWSIFKNHFSGNGNAFGYDMEDLVSYYKLYIDLMNFWQSKFPNRIYNLDYEKLTEEQEIETRKLIDYLGLNFEARCLAFQENKTSVKTASSLQVRKKMYTGSSKVWENYGPFLGQPFMSMESCLN